MKSGSCLPTHYDCLQSFITELEKRGDLVRIMRPVSLVHEVTEIHRRVLEEDGPALLFQNPVDANGHLHAMPLLANLFGSQRRIAWGLGRSLEELPLLAQMLAELRAPTPPRSAGEIWEKLPIAKAALHMRPRRISRAPIHHNVFEGQAVNLDALPIQWCWPGEPAPLITWPLVITRAPDDPSDINVGIYRMQKLGSDRLIMRWLAQRGGARHHRMWQQRGEDMPVAVPANAEIVLEGRVSSFETALEGPYGDHTGYYNSVEEFPVMQVTAITMRKNPVYLSTYTGRPPDEPSRLGEVMNQLFVPVVRKQFPEIADLWLPPAACSYRAMVVSIDKRYPGQARRVMMGLWSMLPQFSYTKLIIAVDPDIDVRNWDDVMWALSTRFDASRDVVTIPGTPVDYLDFASPRSGLGGKLGLDATNKIDPETDREWGTVLAMNEETIARVDAIWDDLGLDRKKQT